VQKADFFVQCAFAQVDGAFLNFNM